jgi:hypothetical protein
VGNNFHLIVAIIFSWHGNVRHSFAILQNDAANYPLFPFFLLFLQFLERGAGNGWEIAFG